MAELNTKKASLQWRRYYPTWGGLNDGLDIEEQWYVEVRREPSRKQVLAIARALVTFDDKGEPVFSSADNGVAMLERSIRGPFNLLVDGAIPESLHSFLIEADSQELIDELERERDRESHLGSEKAKNSDAPSGGDSMQPGDATAGSASDPVEDAPESTKEESKSHEASESGKSPQEARG